MNIGAVEVGTNAWRLGDGKREGIAAAIGIGAADGDGSETGADSDDDDDVTCGGSEEETTDSTGLVSKWTGT